MDGEAIRSGGFVTDEADGVLALRIDRCLNGLQHRNHLIRPHGDHHTRQRAELEFGLTLAQQGCAWQRLSRWQMIGFVQT